MKLTVHSPKLPIHGREIVLVEKASDTTDRPGGVWYVDLVDGMKTALFADEIQVSA